MDDGINMGLLIAMIEQASGADPAVIEQAVQDWLEDHPEATTTVQDGSITLAKLASDVAAKINQVSQLSDEIVDVKSALDGNDVNEQITPTIIPNEWVTSTGTFETAGGWSRTDMIDTGSAKSVTADKDVNIALYSSTGDFLNVRATLTENVPYILNEGVGKIVLYSASAKLNSMTAFFTKPSVIAEVTNAIDSLNELINEKTYIYPASVVSNAYINTNGKLVTGASAYIASDYIPLPFNEVQDFEIRGVVYGNASCAIYDEDYELLLAITENNISQYGGVSSGLLQTLTIPYINGMKYARLSARTVVYSELTDLWCKGNTLNGAFKRIVNIESELKNVEGNVSTAIANSKVLVIGDSISTDAYGSYKKWVTDLIEEGFFPSDTTNSSQHATGFVARYNNEANDFITRIKAVQNPSQYDLVIVFGGINDYIQNVPMGSDSGTDYTVSFKPAVNEFFTYLIQNFTQARLCVLLPLRTYATWTNSEGEYQQAYGDYIKKVAKSYCLPVLNLTEDSGFFPYVQTFRDMWTLVPAGYESADGVHPNQEYERRFLSPMIKRFLQGLM
jgi:lysophospholipase L1-like esterase